MSCTYDVQFPIHEDGDTAALVSRNLDTIASAQRPTASATYLDAPNENEGCEAPLAVRVLRDDRSARESLLRRYRWNTPERWGGSGCGLRDYRVTVGAYSRNTARSYLDGPDTRGSAYDATTSAAATAASATYRFRGTDFKTIPSGGGASATGSAPYLVDQPSGQVERCVYDVVFSLHEVGGTTLVNSLLDTIASADDADRQLCIRLLVMIQSAVRPHSKSTRPYFAPLTLRIRV